MIHQQYSFHILVRMDRSIESGSRKFQPIPTVNCRQRGKLIGNSRVRSYFVWTTVGPASPSSEWNCHWAGHWTIPLCIPHPLPCQLLHRTRSPLCSPNKAGAVAVVGQMAVYFYLGRRWAGGMVLERPRDKRYVTTKKRPRSEWDVGCPVGCPGRRAGLVLQLSHCTASMNIWTRRSRISSTARVIIIRWASYVRGWLLMRRSHFWRTASHVITVRSTISRNYVGLNPTTCHQLLLLVVLKWPWSSSRRRIYLLWMHADAFVHLCSCSFYKTRRMNNKDKEYCRQ